MYYMHCTYMHALTLHIPGNNGTSTLLSLWLSLLSWSSVFWLSSSNVSLKSLMLPLQLANSELTDTGESAASTSNSLKLPIDELESCFVVNSIVLFNNITMQLTEQDFPCSRLSLWRTDVAMLAHSIKEQISLRRSSGRMEWQRRWLYIN